MYKAIHCRLCAAALLGLQTCMLCRYSNSKRAAANVVCSYRHDDNSAPHCKPATVDLPTPPLPEATATMCCTSASPSLLADSLPGPGPPAAAAAAVAVWSCRRAAKLCGDCCCSPAVADRRHCTMPLQRSHAWERICLGGYSWSEQHKQQSSSDVWVGFDRSDPACCNDVRRARAR
jgi:hypothetical protein